MLFIHGPCRTSGPGFSPHPPSANMRPRIGITTSYDDGTQSLDRRYVTAVEEAGGLPLPLPMLDTDAASADCVAVLDGLIITGGPAVTEGLEGALADELTPADPVRATSDRRWIRQCRNAGLPILGICYGMQLLGALAGGTIYGDVEAQRDGALSHSQKREGTSHPITLSNTSRLRRLLDTETLSVNTRHLQALSKPGDNYIVTGRAPDGVIEAIEHTDDWIVGVQFHPERMGAVTQPLFRALVKQAHEPAPAVPSS